ncbi:hypothetical protein DFP93_105222 [Aneurinibacillus soli]|uniref:Uncharacterized protein n=1 Tax=Aneurinibacillus soli TaxID=1500254 RepID=A0A0U5B1T3_9BACL|nr:hypothetical protein [Aneurinibacillus soli]PYE62265.1 hypothetical protein DFP93_105222 [Aneurinibacillus soli]BAU28546.1 hypothetical protein CB4_02721 [Aneurinibacillus soli]
MGSLRLREITNNLQAQNVKVDLNTGNQDKLYLVAGGALYEIPMPQFGNLEETIVEGKVVDLGCRENIRIPGRSRKLK